MLWIIKLLLNKGCVATVLKHRISYIWIADFHALVFIYSWSASKIWRFWFGGVHKLYLLRVLYYHIHSFLTFESLCVSAILFFCRNKTWRESSLLQERGWWHLGSWNNEFCLCCNFLHFWFLLFTARSWCLVVTKIEHRFFIRVHFLSRLIPFLWFFTFLQFLQDIIRKIHFKKKVVEKNWDATSIWLNNVFLDEIFEYFFRRFLSIANNIKFAYFNFHLHFD